VGGLKDIPLDVRVLGFALLCCVGAAVLFGTAPAWVASRKDVQRHLQESSRGNSGGARQRHWRHALIIGEIALALVLLAGAVQFVGGLQRVVGRDPGWRVDGLLTAQMDLTPPNTKPRINAAFSELGASGRNSRRAGVSFSSRTPVLGSRTPTTWLSKAGRSRRPDSISTRCSSP
jgi:hypothetical protein